MMLVPQTIAGCCIAIHMAGGSIQGAHASTCVHVQVVHVTVAYHSFGGSYILFGEER